MDKIIDVWAVHYAKTKKKIKSVHLHRKEASERASGGDVIKKHKGVRYSTGEIVIVHDDYQEPIKIDGDDMSSGTLIGSVDDLIGELKIIDLDRLKNKLVIMRGWEVNPVIMHRIHQELISFLGEDGPKFLIIPDKTNLEFIDTKNGK